MSRLRTAFEVLVIAYNRFVLHDAWAIASHIALSILMSMFPFLILVTALASMFGTGSLADEAADIILEAWPSEVAKPIADEVHSILTVRREGILTLGLVLALYFASSGVEALRVVGEGVAGHSRLPDDDLHPRLASGAELQPGFLPDVQAVRVDEAEQLQHAAVEGEQGGVVRRHLVRRCRHGVAPSPA